jgi:hypothetical protein
VIGHPKGYAFPSIFGLVYAATFGYIGLLAAARLHGISTDRRASDEAESTEAVISLRSQGRKRGYAGPDGNTAITNANAIAVAILPI